MSPLRQQAPIPPSVVAILENIVKRLTRIEDILDELVEIVAPKKPFDPIEDEDIINIEDAVVEEEDDLLHHQSFKPE